MWSALRAAASRCSRFTQLLMHALKAALIIADSVGLFGVEVVAKSAAARAFYGRFGFKSLVDDELHLYMPLATAQRAFE